MTLYDIINYAIIEVRTNKRFKACRTIIGEYTQGEPVDILLTLSSGWVQGFADFLSTYPNRLSTQGEYLSRQMQLIYLDTLRSLLRKAVALGVYPDIDPVTPVIRTMNPVERRTRAPRREASQVPDHKAALRSLCTLRLSAEHDTLRRIYYLGILTGGLEIPELLALTVKSDGPRRQVLTAAGTPLSRPDIILSLVTPLRSEEGGEHLLPYLDGPEGADPEAVAASLCASMRLMMDRYNISLYRGASIFSDLLCMAVGRLSPDAIIRAVDARFAPGEAYLRDIASFQALFSGVYTDYGMLIYRWYAMRSVTPRKSGDDIYHTIIDDKDLSPLVTDSYVPTDYIIVDRKGKKTVRNHSAVNSLIFIKTLRPYIPRILKGVGEVAAYKRGKDVTDGYAPVPYAEIYKMKLVLGAFGTDGGTEIFTDEELHSRFDTADLAVGDTVTVAKPGYEHFTAKVIRRKNKNSYCVTFPDLGINVVMADIPRALITPVNA